MSTNKYVNYNTPTNEQKLIRDMFTEAVQIYGVDVFYIPRTLVKEDTIFHEDIMSSFDASYKIEMYVDSYNMYEDHDDFVSKLGLLINDTLKLSVSVDRFAIEVPQGKPKEGDLIYFPTGNALFEISFVENEQQFYPLGTLPSFKLSCKIFKYNMNDMNTGIVEIDKYEDTYDVSDTGVDPFASNVDIQTEANTVLDFSEKNPFGTF